MSTLSATERETEMRRGPGAALRSIGHFFLVDGLLVTLLIALIVVFSLLLPDSFPTAFNFRSILSAKAVVTFTALAVLIPLAANQFDLSVGYWLGLSHILAVGLQAKAGMPWVLTVVLVIGAGALIGLINGLLVTRAQINSFIATLGTGTVLFGFASMYTKGEQIVGDLPTGFTGLARNVAGIPLPAILVIIAGLLLWVCLERLPIGRHLFVIGANPRAATLLGIPSERYITGSFVASGVLTACGGVLLAAELRVGQLATGPEYLLPAFAAALLGATALGKGRVNVWGTFVSVLILAVAVSGLQQLGAADWVEPIFNGTILVVAVGLASFVARRRLASRGALGATPLASSRPDGEPPQPPPGTHQTSQASEERTTS